MHSENIIFSVIETAERERAKHAAKQAVQERYKQITIPEIGVADGVSE